MPRVCNRSLNARYDQQSQTFIFTIKITNSVNINPDILLVIGGKPKRQNVEWVDLTGGALPDDCQSTSDVPEEMVGSFGAFVNGKPIICGGWKVDKCYTFDQVENRWINRLSLDRPRQNAASVQLDDGTWYIMGGRDNTADSVNLDTTLILKDGVFQLGPRLPYATNNPCVAKVSQAMHLHGA